MWHDPSRVRAALRGIWNPASARRLAEVLEFLDPHDTVLHLHSWSKALSSSVVRVADRRGFRVVTTLHDFLGVCPTGTLFNHQAGQCCPLKPMSLACVATDCDANSYPQKLWRVARHAMQGTMGRLPSRGGDLHRCGAGVEARRFSFLAPLLPSGRRCGSRRPFRHTYLQRACTRRDAVIRSSSSAGFSAEKGRSCFAECLERLVARSCTSSATGSCRPTSGRCPGPSSQGWLSSGRVRERVRQARTLVFPSLSPEERGLVVAEAAGAQAVPRPSSPIGASGARTG